MHKECGTSRRSKLVRIGDLCIGLISHLHWPTTFSISAPIHHHGDIPLPPPCCSMGFCPHIPGSHPCLRFHPHQSGVLSPPKVSSSPSMVHDLSGHIQDWEHMQHLGTCGAPTYL